MVFFSFFYLLYFFQTIKRGKHNCDLNKETYACYDCNETDAEANGNIVEITEDMSPESYFYTGQCATAVRPSNQQITASHDTCQLGFDWEVGGVSGAQYENEYTPNKAQTSILSPKGGWDPTAFEDKQLFKPSIGTDGRFCVCTQSQATNYFTVDANALSQVQDTFEAKTKTNIIEIEIENETETKKNNSKKKKNKNKNKHKNKNIETKTSTNNVIELYQDDFTSGTYRIEEGGTYKIMEDIVFEFNMGSLDDPQAQNGWKPNSEQVDRYPGAGVAQGRDEYFLGFFAGITIETDDVVLDLNGKSLEMSDIFYQQRWFTIISLTSQFFLPGNGPGFFGYNARSVSNVVIKDGTLGLSSHFGIHGNYNKKLSFLFLFLVVPVLLCFVCALCIAISVFICLFVC